MNIILITGAGGMLATDLKRFLSKKNKFEVISLEKQQLDITDKKSVESAFNKFKPDIVVHTAAMTNVDYCEEHIEDANNINGYGTENIAYYSYKAKSKLVYISSCGLFGDEIKPYSEADEVVLKTQYARSKYLGEKKVESLCEKYFVVRPGWLFGGSFTHKKNFVYNRYLEGVKNPVVKSALDKYGCPTYTYHLAAKILELLDTEYYGVYHVSNAGYATRYQYVREIVKAFGLKTEVIGVNSNEFIRKAPVPDCEIISNKHLESKGLGLLNNWESAIEEYIYILKKELQNNT